MWACFSGAAQSTHSHNGGWLCAAILPYPVISHLVQAARPIIAGAANSIPHTTGPVRAGAVPSSPHTSRPARTGADSSSLLTARPVSRLSPGGAKVANCCLLEEFSALVCSIKWLLLVSHDIVYHIITQGPPITCKFWKLDSEKLVATKAELKQLEDGCIIHQSTSPWSSKLHMVKKADQSWPPAGNSAFSTWWQSRRPTLCPTC